MQDKGLLLIKLRKKNKKISSSTYEYFVLSVYF